MTAVHPPATRNAMIKISARKSTRNAQPCIGGGW
jgi:hypothetical protein